MPGKGIRELRNKHQGEDIWVVASGPSTGFVEPGFFANKVTIGVNRVWSRLVPNYLVIKEHTILPEALSYGVPVVCSRYHCGNTRYAFNPGPATRPGDGELYWFEHVNNELTRMDLDVVGDLDKLVVSYSTITSAIHLAAYMGAANILLVGHDCGKLDGQVNYPGYGRPLIDKDNFYEQFIRDIEPQTLALREKLAEVYGCRIYSLNPFLNLGMEGHRYER